MRCSLTWVIRQQYLTEPPCYTHALACTLSSQCGVGADPPLPGCPSWSIPLEIVPLRKGTINENLTHNRWITQSRMGEVDPGTVLCFPVHGRGTTTQCRPVVNRFTQIIHLRPPQPYQELVLLYFTSKEMALRGLVTCPNQTKRLASSGWRTSGIREPASLPTTLSVVRLGASC